jgi:flagellar basal-body rod protein FlgB
MAFLNGNSTRTIDLMQRAMGGSVLRSQVLNNNIANASTPNYKRKDITFQAELQRAIRSEKLAPGVPFKKTSKNHIPLMRAQDFNEVQPKVYTEFNTYQNNNGNSVDVEKEMMESTKNTMYFNALAQRTAKEFSKLKRLMA